MAVADTSFPLDLTRGPGSRLGRKARTLLRRLVADEEPLATTRFNVAELLVGVARAPDEEKERGKVEHLLRPFTILGLQADAAEAFGRIVGQLQSAVRPIGDMDALIGAVALTAGHPVVTRNARHFEQTPGLPVITW